MDMNLPPGGAMEQWIKDHKDNAMVQLVKRHKEKDMDKIRPEFVCSKWYKAYPEMGLDCDTLVMDVPGGWILNHWGSDNNCMVFVPFSVEEKTTRLLHIDDVSFDRDTIGSMSVNHDGNTVIKVRVSSDYADFLIVKRPIEEVRRLITEQTA